MNRIKEITIATAQGVKQYTVGARLIGTLEIVEDIKIVPLYFTGDPFDHYVGYNKDGKQLFTIHPLCPCIVDFFTTP